MCLICLKFEIQYLCTFTFVMFQKRRLYINYSLKSFTVSKHGNKNYYIYKEKVNVFFFFRMIKSDVIFDMKKTG